MAGFIVCLVMDIRPAQRVGTNELAGNRETQRSGAACLVDRCSDSSAGVAGGATGRVAAS